MIFLNRAGAIATGLEDRSRFLLVQPAQKFLETFIRANFFHRIEIIAQLIVRPGFVDEILAALAGRRDLASALATRHDMMPARGHLPQTKDARVIHGPGLFQVRRKLPGNFNWPPRPESHPDLRFQRPAHYGYATRQRLRGRKLHPNFSL